MNAQEENDLELFLEPITGLAWKLDRYGAIRSEKNGCGITEYDRVKKGKPHCRPLNEWEKLLKRIGISLDFGKKIVCAFDNHARYDKRMRALIIERLIERRPRKVSTDVVIFMEFPAPEKLEKELAQV